VNQRDPCWSPDGSWLAYGNLFNTPIEEQYLRRVDLGTREVTKIEGSEGLWSPKCASDGRILARFPFQSLRPGTWAALNPQGGYGEFFKLRDPRSGAWTVFFNASPSNKEHHTWSRDGRFVYAYLTAPRSVVRFLPGDRRTETVYTVEGLGEPLSMWMGLDPGGAPLVHRDVSHHEIVVMGWEER
jgi:hypothetical protein